MVSEVLSKHQKQVSLWMRVLTLIYIFSYVVWIQQLQKNAFFLTINTTTWLDDRHSKDLLLKIRDVILQGLSKQLLWPHSFLLHDTVCWWTSSPWFGFSHKPELSTLYQTNNSNFLRYAKTTIPSLAAIIWNCLNMITRLFTNLKHYNTSSQRKQCISSEWF